MMQYFKLAQEWNEMYSKLLQQQEAHFRGSMRSISSMKSVTCLTFFYLV